MGVVRQAARRALAVVVPRRLLLARGPIRRPAVCLTFDDGPHPEHTPRLLDVLAAERVKATFFVVGWRAQRYPDLIRRMVVEGHDVGHHSYFHREPAATSCRALMQEVDETLGLLRDEFGIDSKLFRPPKGAVTLAKLTGLWARGQTVVLWTVDPRDYARSAGQVWDALSARPLCPGDVLLMHDTHPNAVSVMPALALQLREQGLRTEPASVWLTRSGAAANAGAA